MPTLPLAYLRQPTIQGDSIVFVSDDDLWRVDAAGGVAARLTASQGEPGTPCLSPDGEWLAFAGRDEHHVEVWVMPAAGGAARRLTWLGAESSVRGFTPDGDILFISNHGQPFFRHFQAFTLPLQGGRPQRIELGQVDHLAFGANGARAIGRNTTADPARWKRYRGGRAGHLWVDADGSGHFERLGGLPGNVTCPMWIGERLYYLGDGEGIGNLYSCRVDGSDIRRHTDHAEHYARQAQTDGRRIVYQCGAALWLFDPAQDSTHEIDVQVPAARQQCATRFVPAAEHLQGVRLHPEGHSIAVEARGRLFTLPLWEGAVREHGAPGPVRRRFGQWLADGRTLACVSDASAEERIVSIGDDGERSFDWDVGRVTGLQAAPVGALLAITNHRNELLIGDAASGASWVADRSECARIEDVAWSPDAAWLAYAFAPTPRHVAIKLLDVASGRSVLATQPEFHDTHPSFDPSGRYLYFLSARTFDPVYDNLQFEMSFPRGARPYLLALQAGGAPPFDRTPQGLGKPAEEPAPSSVAPVQVRVDLDGLTQRIAPFPVPEGRFGSIAGVRGGKVLWTQLPLAGAHGRGGHKDAPGRVEVFDFATAEATTLVAQADGFSVAADHVTVLVRHDKRVRAISALAKPEDERAARPPSADDRPSRKSGWIDLARIRVRVDPPAEWRQMLREVWRLQREQFWVPNMSGIDWHAVWERHAPLLPRVATRGELSDLIWELQGELGTSHAYESGGDHRRPPAVAMGFLAADLRFIDDMQGYEITRIAQGDAWEAQAASPLLAVGVEARVGERIVAVGGQAVSKARPPESLLVHQGGVRVALTLAAAGGSGRREVLVAPLPDETPVRYREWVERKRAWVHERSGGRVGYFHLPDMMAHGFAEFHRYFATECDREALVVDLRFNRGGHVSQLLLEKVARRRIGWNVSRWGRPQPYPDAAVSGPVVALANEHSGSDGDIFSHGFKLMNIGTLIGKRTWGGVIGIHPRHLLADGSETTQPEFSFWFKDVGFGVENHGTEPQIEVDNAPQDAAAGLDRQLETAVREALDAIDREGASIPDFGPRPHLAAPPLPPRKGA